MSSNTATRRSSRVSSAPPAVPVEEKASEPKKPRASKKTSKTAKSSKPEKKVSATSNDSSSDSYSPTMGPDGKMRCWGGFGTPMVHYHDFTWGRTEKFHPPTLDRKSPVYREFLERAFASMVYQSMQAGLTWRMIFNRLDGMKEAFDHFNLEKVAKYDEQKISQLLLDPRIIRNRLKVLSVIENAKKILELEEKFPGGFYGFLFLEEDRGEFLMAERHLKGGKLDGSYMRSDFVTKSHDRLEGDGVHPTISIGKLSKRLKDFGFKFVGETVILSFAQAVGLVNHHATSCWAFQECEKEWEKVKKIREEQAKQAKRAKEEESSQAAENTGAPAKKRGRKEKQPTVDEPAVEKPAKKGRRQSS